MNLNSSGIGYKNTFMMNLLQCYGCMHEGIERKHQVCLKTTLGQID